jgi:hypothetical protein
MYPFGVSSTFTSEPNAADEARLARLEQQGLVRRASVSLPREVLISRAPRPSEGSGLEALLAERKEEER